MEIHDTIYHGATLGTANTNGYRILLFSQIAQLANQLRKTGILASTARMENRLASPCIMSVDVRQI